MYNNQQGILDSILSNDKIQLRGGGSCSSQAKKIKNYNQIEELKNKLKQLKHIKGVPNQQLQTLIKEILDVIVSIYKDESEYQTVREENEYHQQFHLYIEQINKILIKKDSLVGKWCLEYYLELIKISLENLSTNVSKNKGINIIDLFIKISRQNNNNQNISQLIEAANILLIDVQCRYYNQLQKFETFFFFNTLNQIIKEKVAKGLQVEVKKNFDKIKHQYIQHSSNWILHNCWIEFLVDLLIYCQKYQQQNQLQTSKAQGIKEANSIITYISNQEGSNLFEIYINNFQYNESQNNRWKCIDNPEIHRLQRILSMFKTLVKQIETQLQEFQLSEDSTKIYQIFQNIYYDFIITQIYFLELLQSIYKIQQNVELNLQNQSVHIKQKSNQMMSLINKAIVEIKSHFNIESIYNCYCQLQMIEKNKFDKNKFLKNKSTIHLQSQINQLNQLINVIQTLILQEILIRSNIESKQNHSSLSIKQIFKSDKFYSIEFSSPIIERLEDLSLQITIHLLQYKNIKLLQKIYVFKLKHINSNLNQVENSIQINKDKIAALKKLKQNLFEIQQLGPLQQQFKKIIENTYFYAEKYIIRGQEGSDSNNGDFWDDQEFPQIYKSQYQEIEQIRVQSCGDEYKVRQCLKFHFQAIQDSLENQKSSINSQFTQSNSNNTNSCKLQEVQEIFEQVDYACNKLNTDSVGAEKNLELEQIIKQKVEKIQPKNKMQIALMAQQKRYDDSMNQFVQVGQQRELFNEFLSDQDSKDFLNAEINDFIWSNENQNVVLLISGPNGCGKTKTLKKLEKQLLQHYKVNQNGHNWIPIYVNLIQNNKPDELLLIQVLKNEYKELNKLQEFYQAILKGQENVVLILDIQDSIENIILSNQLQKKITNLNQNVTLKIIMTTRKDINSLKHLKLKNMQFTEIQLINSDQQQEYIKQSYKRLIINEIIKVQKQSTNENNLDWEIIKKQIDQLFYQIPIFYLMPENTEANLKLQLGKIINNIEFEQLIQQKMKKMKYFLENLLIPYLKDILLTPLLLKIAIKHLQNTENFESLKSINLNGKVSPLKNNLELILLPINAQIYSKYKVLECFINQCHYRRKKQNESSDLQISFEEFQNNLKLSCLNDVNGQSQLQSQILINNQESFSIEIFEISSSTNSKLITFNNNQIQFLHQQILDFFIAQKIVTLLWNKGEITEFLNNKQVNLSQKQNEGVVELLIDPLKNDEFKKRNLKEIVQLTISDKSKIRASSNGIFLLSKMGACLENWDFKGIKIENTSMIGLNAINCDFTESEIKNVEIDFCNFNCCKLNKAVFTDVSCCEFPEINETAEVLQVVSFKQDQQLAVLKQNGKVNIWNIETVEREQVEIENLVKNKYKQIIISKDDSTLFALTDYQIEFWNLDNYYSSTHISFISKSKYMCLSPDNTLIMCGVQNQDIEIVKYTKKDQMWRKQQMPLSIKQDAVQMAINHSNELLVVKNTQNQIQFFNLENSNEILIQQQISGNTFTTTTDGKILIILHNNQINFYQFEISNGTLKKQKSCNISKLEDPIGLHICENSQTILIQGQNQTSIFYEETIQLQQLPKRFYGENSVLSRNGKIFINWKDSKVQLWDLKTLNKTKQREAIDDYIKCCQYSPDGQKLLIISSKRTLFYNINQNTYHWIFESIYSFCFRPKKRKMLVTFSKQGLKFWEIDADHQFKSSKNFDVFQQQEVRKLIFSKNGEWLACCNRNNVSIMNVSKILNASNRNCQLEDIKQIPGLNYNEKDQFNFSIDLLQYSFDKKQLLQFNPQQEQCKILKQFDQNCEAQTFSSSGKYFAFVNKSEVIIYNISNQEGYLNQKVKHEINTIQFSNNETQQQLVTLNHTQIYIYLITEKNSIRMLQQIQVIQLNQRVHSLQFHPNDLQFLVATNREIFLYDKQQQSTQYKMSKKFTGSDELCSLNTEITELRISSELQQQNLRLVLLQKGAITKPIST